MAEWIGVYGNTGSGKSTSMFSLDPTKTFLFQTTPKKIPFQGGKRKYKKVSKEDPTGNYVVTADYEKMTKQMVYISNHRPEIKQIFIDDASYLLTEDYFDDLMVKKQGDNVFEMYNRIASNFWQLIKCIRTLREDLIVILVAHTQDNGKMPRTFKTVGTLLDRQLVIEGLTSVIFEAKIIKGKHVFQTNKVNNQDPCKSPLGMFAEKYIPNDLQKILDRIEEYDNSDGEEALTIEEQLKKGEEGLQGDEATEAEF